VASRERPIRLLGIALDGLSNAACCIAMAMLVWSLAVAVIAVTEAWARGAVLAGAILLEGVAAMAVAMHLATAAERLERPLPPPCAACGYDLRFLVSRRCPECGRPVPHVAAS
jgi:hypothetical protein